MLDQLLFLLLLYCVMSILSIVLYGLDKKAAIASRRRIRENTLHIISLLGGWPGALYARQYFRHKTRKISFRIQFWITVFLNIAIAAWSFMPEGRAVLAGFIGSL